MITKQALTRKFLSKKGSGVDRGIYVKHAVICHTKYRSCGLTQDLVSHWLITTQHVVLTHLP